MTKLTDTEQVILTAARQRNNWHCPLPKRRRAVAVQRSINALSEDCQPQE